jgi:hypothetical protein
MRIVSVAVPKTLAATGLASGFVSGSHEINLLKDFLYPTGLASTFASGSHTMKSIIKPSGLASTLAYGSHTLHEWSSELTVYINGSEETALLGSFAYVDKINARSTASITILTDSTITVGMGIIIRLGADKLFAGTIDSYTLMYLRGENAVATRRAYACSCVDYNQIPDRRYVAASYEDETAEDIIQDIVDNYLDGEGITLMSVAGGSTVVKQASFNRIPVSRAFDYMKDLLVCNWNIDENKYLSFFTSQDNINDGFDDSTCLSMVLKATRQDYRNRQLIRGGDSTTETQTDETPTPKPDGESRVFMVRLPIAKKPTIKINTVAVSDSDVGILGLDDGKEWYWNKGSNNVVQDTTETVLSDTDTITVSYQGLKSIIAKVENLAEQSERATLEGGSGIYERLDNKRDMDDRDAIFDYADGLIQRYGEITKQVVIESRVLRKAGDIIPVTSANLDYTDTMLVTNVSGRDVGNNEMRYTITAVSGEDIGDWVEFFKRLTKGDDTENFTNETVVILQDFAEKLKYSGQYTIGTATPTYPGTALYPSQTLVPNSSSDQEVVYD